MIFSTTSLNAGKNERLKAKALAQLFNGFYRPRGSLHFSDIVFFTLSKGYKGFFIVEREAIKLYYFDGYAVYRMLSFEAEVVGVVKRVKTPIDFLVPKMPRLFSFLKYCDEWNYRLAFNQNRLYVPDDFWEINHLKHFYLTLENIKRDKDLVFCCDEHRMF